MWDLPLNESGIISKLSITEHNIHFPRCMHCIAIAQMSDVRLEIHENTKRSGVRGAGDAAARQRLVHLGRRDRVNRQKCYGLGRGFFARLQEISSCSCSTALPGPAWVLISKIYLLFSRSLYSRNCLVGLQDYPDHGDFLPL